MDAKVYSAQNKASNRILSPKLVVVDAAREPNKAFKILMEGLADSARTGIWLVNFKGFPVVRAASDFDLVYLDEEHRVLHAVEMSEGGDFEPFRGQPASVLVLLSKTINRSRTFTGDRITFEPAEHRTNDAQAEPALKRTARSAARVTTASGAKTFNVPSGESADSQAKKPQASGRLMRSGSPASGSILGLQPPAPPAAERSQQNGIEKKGAVVPISAASAPAPDAERGKRRDETERREVHRAVPAAASAAASTDEDIEHGAKRTIAPIPREVRTNGSAYTAESASAVDRPLPAHSFPATNAARLESTQPAPRKQATVEKSDNAAERRSSSLFSSPGVTRSADLAKLSSRIRSWLSSPAEKKYKNKRRAPRIADPGLVGYYFAGGPPTPHEIRNLSAMGFYMITDQRWIPGTVIQVTLQPRENDGENATESVTVQSRVVSFGPDGTGFEFVSPRREE